MFQILKESGYKPDSSEEAQKGLQEISLSKSEEESFNKRQRDMLKCIQERKYITVQQYAEVARVSPNTARADLKTFHERGLIQKIGKARHTEYRVSTFS